MTCLQSNSTSLLAFLSHCVLSDFGLACKLKNKKDTKRGRVGTPGYLPPEMLRKEHHSYPADWYSYGCTMYALLRGLVRRKKEEEECRGAERVQRTGELTRITFGAISFHRRTPSTQPSPTWKTGKRLR